MTMNVFKELEKNKFVLNMLGLSADMKDEGVSATSTMEDSPKKGVSEQEALNEARGHGSIDSRS